MCLNQDREGSTVISTRLSLGALILGAVLASCGPDALEGRIVLSGSSTLAPLMERTVERWKKLHPRVETRVEAIGSDAGLARLVQYNDADLALLSRPLTDADLAAAEALGKRLWSLPVAWDAVTLVVPASNTWATSLTARQAAEAFTTASLWSDLDPSWPSVPLNRFVQGSQSGTTDLFAAAFLDGDKGRLYNRPAFQSSEDDGILARGLASVEGSIGFLGWTTVVQSDLPLRLLALEGIKPSAATIASRAYGLPRQLWLVGDKRRQKNPSLASLVRFLYDQYPSLIGETPLVGLTEEERLSAESVLKESL